VLGPWNHGGARGEGRAIGHIQFEGATAVWFRRHVMQPFLDRHLRERKAPDLPEVLVYETGADRWHHLGDWPQVRTARPLYLLAGGWLGFDAPGSDGYDEYVSDPAKPVPYRPRPIARDDTEGQGQWLTEDQRHVDGRPDVLTYQTAPLAAPVRIAGQPFAELLASTSGTDADWVVKLIDVWPDEYPVRPAMGGYQQMISADIFRGRYRADLAVPHALEAGAPLRYRIPLPHACHTFLPGHRIMVQIQSSWFPLYDRNPQTFVPNIFYAEPGDYVRATHRIYRGSAIAMPVADD
jgi:putative CocE/NonD family hydrolase